MPILPQEIRILAFDQIQIFIELFLSYFQVVKLFLDWLQNHFVISNFSLFYFKFFLFARTVLFLFLLIFAHLFIENKFLFFKSSLLRFNNSVQKLNWTIIFDYVLLFFLQLLFVPQKQLLLLLWIFWLNLCTIASFWTCTVLPWNWQLRLTLALLATFYFAHNTRFYIIHIFCFSYFEWKLTVNIPFFPWSFLLFIINNIRKVVWKTLM